MDNSTFSCCAYCWKNEEDWTKVLHYKCDGCNKNIHYGCIKSDQPSPLQDDTFFHFKCDSCSETQKEDFNRMNLSWQDTVALSLYHLQRTYQGKCGFFHWKSHICAFIDSHWRCFFGLYRKKTTLWMGTVAGTLSTGCPHLFTSGASTVDMGFWRLTNLKPPLPYAEKKRMTAKKKTATEPQVYLNPDARRCRRPKDNVLAAAIELKEKKIASMAKNKGKSKRGKLAEGSKSTESTANKGKKQSSVPEDAAPVSESEDASSWSSSCISSNPDIGDTSGSTRLDFLNAIKLEAEDEEDDLDIDIGSVSTLDGLPDIRPESPSIYSALECVTDVLPDQSSSRSTVADKSPVKQSLSSSLVKQEPQEPEDAAFNTHPNHSDQKNGEDSDGPEDEDEEEENDVGELDDSEDADDDEEEEEEEEDDEDAEEGEGEEDGQKAEDACGTSESGARKPKRGCPRKRRRSDDALPPSPPPRLARISVFEERELLQRLDDSAKQQRLRPDLAQLRRKLICNQTNREFSLPVFDLDSQVEKLTKSDSNGRNPDLMNGSAFFPKLPTKSVQVKETRDLDRFMMHESAAKAKSRTYTTFRQRLVGFEDHELKPFVSPYTTRVLLPFIWRNNNPLKKPLKLRLLQEIQAYPHRNDPSWKAPPSPSIDFCYVRPEHIPSVNALSREFFWPGIDMSECLQYPDFSCVVLYRKIVIGFAFMVPDRGYNEAYISFIFTHPEWRGVGIATFMLYHLIQTCMGKDVLLHVSASNPAMMLYQKFGFKAQELILNFYYKYFPYDCKDSTHAFLMRLTR